MANTIALLDPGTAIQPDFDEPDVRDVREWVELFRRLHLPNYEEARLKWSLARAEGYFADANQVSAYTQEALQEIIKLEDET